MAVSAQAKDPPFIRGLVGQAEVVHALIMRETRTRFGFNQLGYLWAVFEPLMMVLTFYIVFLVANRRPPGQMDTFSFVTTGLIPYNVFIHSLNRVSQSIAGNRALLFYPQVRPIEIAMARALLEVATYVMVFMVVMGGHALYYQQFEIDNVMLVVAGFAFSGLLGASIGLVMCALNEYSSAVDRIRGPLFRPLFWISGVFFAANELPGRARELLAYNPLLHAIEMVRTGWFPGYTSTEADVSYVLMWLVVVVALSLVLERMVRARIELS